MTTSNKTGSLIDNGVAALAAASGGFLAFAMPGDLFARIIIASRIPELLSAAQPPLGMKARLAVAILVAVIAYAFVWSLLRALDRIGSGASAPAYADENEEEDDDAAPAPRLRRADAHPDAPSRRPLFAASDLGEPDDDIYDLSEAAPAPAPAGRLPSFLVPQAEAQQLHAAPEPEAAAEPAPEPKTGFGRGPIRSEPEPRAEAPEPEPRDEAVAPESEPVRAPQPAGEPIAAVQAEDEEEEGHDASEGSLSKLMQRFESGLTRKQQATEIDLSGPPIAAAPPPDHVGHRLRSAITDLNKLSAGGR